MWVGNVGIVFTSNYLENSQEKDRMMIKSEL